MQITFSGKYEQNYIAKENSMIVSFKEEVLSSGIILLTYLVIIVLVGNLKGVPIPYLIESRLALVMVILSIPVHEFLHIIILPRQSHIKIFYSFKPMAIIIIPDIEISKCRALIFSFLPLTILGLLPLLLYLVYYDLFPQECRDFLLTFSFFSAMGSASDVWIIKFILQLPKGERIDMS